MTASSLTEARRHTEPNGSSVGRLNLDRIRRLAAEYENDPEIPELTMDQALAVLCIFARRPRRARRIMRQRFAS